MDAFGGWDYKEEKVKPVKMQGREGLSDWSWDVDALIGGLGDSFKIMECGMKAFPTEALTHTHLSATLNVVTKNNITYDQIKEVEITTFAQAYDILFDPAKYRPESRETADHSLPYCIAANPHVNNANSQFGIKCLQHCIYIGNITVAISFVTAFTNRLLSAAVRDRIANHQQLIILIKYQHRFNPSLLELCK